MSDLADLLGGGFDTHSVEPQQDFDVIPPGKYPVMIEKAEIKLTKSQNGHYLELTLLVLDGPCKNRKVWDRINIQNPNQQAQDIALSQLAALGQALGLAAIGDTAQLLNQAVIASVKVKNEQNEVRTYHPLTPAGAPGIPQVPAPPPPQYAPPPAPTQPAPQYAPQPVQQAPQYAPPAQTAPQYAPPAQPQYAPPPAQQAPTAAGGKPPWAR